MAVKVPWGLGAFFALCCALSLSIGVQSHSWGRFPSPHAITEQHTPSLQVATLCPTLRIAVINGVNFHFEVLASVLTVLQHFAPYTDVYLNKFVQGENFNGAFDIVHWFPGTFKKAAPSAVDRRYDMVFLISYDYEMQDNTELVTLMKPTVLVAYIHNAQLGLKKLLALAPQVKLLTLSPHVAKSLQQYSNRSANWMLPVYNMDVHEDCLTFPQRWVMGLCLRGFALQGKFSNLRRNYSSIWRQMTDKLTTIRDPQIGKVFHVNVLGKGEDRLALPTWLESHVNVHKRLMYQQFFNTIAHNVALIPSLANPRYYTEKFSSTVLTSFITGTPVLAHDQLLTAYSFLTPDVVYLQQPGEEEMDAMLRLATMKPNEIIKVRLSLLKLRDQMNARSGRMIEEIVAEACKANRKKAAAQAA